MQSGGYSFGEMKAGLFENVIDYRRDRDLGNIRYIQIQRDITSLKTLTLTGLFQNFLPVLGGGHVLPFLKGGAEAGLAVEAGAEGNILDGGLRGFEQIFGGGQTGFDQVLVRGDAGFPGKDPREMVRAHAGLGRQLFQGQIALKMLVDIGNGVCHGGAIDLAVAVFVGRVEKAVQKAGDAAGEPALQNRGGGPEYIVNLL